MFQKTLKIYTTERIYKLKKEPKNINEIKKISNYVSLKIKSLSV